MMKKLLLLLPLFLCFTHSAHATTCGYTTIGAGNGNGTANVQWAAAKCVPGANSTVTDCQVYDIGSVGGTVNCAIFADSSGTPTNVICQGTAVTAVASAWNLISLSGCGTLTSGTTYWIVALVSSANFGLAYDTAAVGNAWKQTGVTCCTFVNYSAATDADLIKISAYADITTGGGTSPQKRRKVGAF